MSLKEDWHKLPAAGKVVLVGGGAAALYFLWTTFSAAQTTSSTAAATPAASSSSRNGITKSDLNTIVQNAVSGVGQQNQQQLASVKAQLQQNQQAQAAQFATLQQTQQTANQQLLARVGTSATPSASPARSLATTKSLVVARSPKGGLFANRSYATAVNEAGGYYHHHKFVAGKYVNGKFVAKRGG